MHRVTLVFILFLLIPDLYIYLVYVVRKTRKTFLRSLYWLPTLLLAAGYVYFMFLTGDNAMSNHTQAIGRLAITIMLFVFPKTIYNPQIEMFARFKMKSSFHKTKRII